jgi:hypothetical protein
MAIDTNPYTNVLNLGQGATPAQIRGGKRPPTGPPRGKGGRPPYPGEPTGTGPLPPVTVSGTKTRTNPNNDPFDLPEWVIRAHITATEEEMREMYGLPDSVDVDALRFNRRALELANDQWFGRITQYTDEVRKGGRVTEYQRKRMREYNELIADPLVPVATVKSARERDYKVNKLQLEIEAGKELRAPPTYFDIPYETVLGEFDPSQAGEVGDTDLPYYTNPFSKEPKRRKSPGQQLRNLKDKFPVVAALVALTNPVIAQNFDGITHAMDIEEVLAQTLIQRGEEMAASFSESASTTLKLLQGTDTFGRGRAGSDEAGKKFAEDTVQSFKDLARITQLSSDDVLQWYETRLADFQDQPIAKQIAFNPFVVGGLAYSGIKVGTGILRSGRQLNRATLIDLGEVDLLNIRMADEILERTDRSLLAKATDLPGVRQLRKAINPSADLGHFAKGSDEELLLQTSILYKNWVAESRTKVEFVMRQLRSLGDWNKEFGFRSKEGYPTGLAHNVPGTPVHGDLFEKANLLPINIEGMSDITKNLLSKTFPKFDEAARVMPNNPRVVLTPVQKDMITALRQMYADALELQVRNGIDVSELYQFDDLVHFVARRTTKESGGHIILDHVRGGGTAAHLKSRGRDPDSQLVKDMSDQMKQGKYYISPVDTAEFYMNEMYSAIVRKRIAAHVAPASRRLATPEGVKASVAIEKQMADRQVRSMRVVKQVMRELNPAGATRAMMRRAFPELEDEIDHVLSFKGLTPDKMAADIVREIIRELPVSKRAMRVEIRKLLNRVPHMIERQDVMQAVSAMGVSTREHVKTTSEIFRAINKTLGKVRADKLNELYKSMEELHGPVAEHMRDISRETGRLRTKLIGKFPGEAQARTAPFLSMRFGTKAELGRIRTLKDPEKFVKGLDKIFEDNGIQPFKFVSDLNDAIRLMKTTYDFGAAMIQGLPTLMRDPEAWGFSFGMSVRAFKDDGVRAAYVARNKDWIIEAIENGVHLGSTEWTQSMERGGWFAKLAVVGQTNPSPIVRVGTGPLRQFYRFTGRFQSSFDTFLDLARLENYKALRGTAMRSKDPKALSSLADFVNKLTGTTDSSLLGVGATQRQFESALVMFSPRYTRATVALLGDMVRGGLRGSEARIAIGRLFAGQAILHIAGAASLDVEPNLIPGTAEFLKLPINGQLIGFGGKPNALLNLGIDLVQQLAGDNPEGLFTWNMISQASYDENEFLKRLRYQFPWPMATGINALTGVDPIGRHIVDPGDTRDIGDYTGQVVKSIGPFWADAAIEAGGLEGLLTAGLGEASGLVTLPVQGRHKRDSMRDEHAQRLYRMTWDELGRDLYGASKRDTIDALPEMQEVLKEARREEAQFARNDERLHIKKTRERYDKEFIQTIMPIDARFKLGVDLDRAGFEMRKGVRGAMHTRSVQQRTLHEERQEYFTTADEYYRELAKESQLVAATNKRFDLMFNTQVLGVFGQPDPRRFDEIREELVAEFGQTVTIAAERESRRRWEALELPSSVQDWFDSREPLQPYWQAYKTALPEEDWPKWEVFDDPNGSEAAKNILRRSSTDNYRRMEQLVEREREHIKRESHYVDEILMRFYDREPEPTHRDLTRRWSQRRRR